MHWLGAVSLTWLYCSVCNIVAAAVCLHGCKVCSVVAAALYLTQYMATWLYCLQQRRPGVTRVTTRPAMCNLVLTVS
jgi:hypothetical protein